MARHFLMLGIVLALYTPAAFAADKSTCDGKMIVGGTTTTLTHVYALVTQTDTRENFYHVIFSDFEISDKDLAVFPDVFMKQFNEGKLHAIRLGLDSQGAVDATDVFDAAGWETIKDENKLELKVLDDKNIAGRLHLTKLHSDPAGTKYDYDIKFSAPVRDESELNQ